MNDLFEHTMEEDQRHSGGDTALIRAFFKFHRANPHVYEIFDRYTREVIARGYANYSSRTILHRVRWHTAIETKGDRFKMNDHHSPYYGRLWMKHNPAHDGFFRTREVLGSIDSAA